MSKPRPDKIVELISQALSNTTPQAVQGGSVTIPVSRAGALWLIPWACNEEIRAGARLLKPKSKKPSALYATPGDTRYALKWTREFNAALTPVTSGSLELFSAASQDAYQQEEEDDEDQEAGRADDTPTYNGHGLMPGQDPKLVPLRRKAGQFRLQGNVDNGVWTITHAFPVASASQLQQAIEILDLVDGSSPRWAHDETEAQVLVALALKSAAFIQLNPAQRNAHKIEARGVEIHLAGEDRRPYLAAVVLRHRMANGAWDLRSNQALDETFLAALVADHKQMEQRMAAAREKYYAPRVRTLLETPTATYYETDFNRIYFGDPSTSLSGAICSRFRKLDRDAFMSFVDLVRLIDSEMAAVGLRHLGDFQNSTQNQTQAFRAYGGARDGSTMAFLGIVAGQYLIHWMFYTLLNDGFWVSTATFPVADKARPQRSSHVGNTLADVRALYEQHVAHVGQNAAQGAPQGSPGDLVSLLKFMDQFNAAVAASRP